MNFQYIKKLLSQIMFVFLFLSFVGLYACGNPESKQEKIQTESSSEVNKTEQQTENSKENVQKESIAQDAGEQPKEAIQETLKEAIQETPKEEIQETPKETKPTQKHVAFVLNSNYIKGSYSLVDLDKKQAIKKDVVGVHSDAVVAVWKDLIFVLNRYNNPKKDDELLILDQKTMSLLHTIKLGAKTNPQDVAVVDKTKAYVSLYGSKDLFIINPTDGKITGKLDLSGFIEKSTKQCKKDADCKDKYGNGSGVCDVANSKCQSDGTPEMSKLLIQNKKLYVLIQGLDRNQGYLPLQSTIALFDTSSDQLIKSIPLKGTNPCAFIAEPSGSFLINELGQAFSPKDGILERLDTKKDVMNGIVFEEKTINASFSMFAVAVVSNKIGYLVANDASFKQMLIQFSLDTGKQTKQLIKDAKLSDMMLYNKQLWVADKTLKGLRIFDAITGAELSQSPVLTGHLPPIYMKILPSIF